MKFFLRGVCEQSKSAISDAKRLQEVRSNFMVQVDAGKKMRGTASRIVDMGIFEGCRVKITGTLQK